MSFLQDLTVASNRLARTENDAVTLKTSGDPLVDLFGLLGAMRRQSDDDINAIVNRAFISEPENTAKALFYLRDIRGGMGERRVFRVAMRELLEAGRIAKPGKLVNLILEFGRFDDAFAIFLGTKEEPVLIEAIKKNLAENTPGLWVKWLPSEGSGSNSKKLARYLVKQLGMTMPDYRKKVSRLRQALELVETKITAKNYRAIDYGRIPSRAGMVYRKAFMRHDEDRYRKFLESVKKGEAKINTANLYPHELYTKVMNADADEMDALNTMWAELPDYAKNSTGIVVADVSGSMTGQPMAVSVSLALYFAERNHGPFKDHFITFSAEPDLQRVEGQTLWEKMQSIRQADWQMNTCLQSVFDLILETATANDTPSDELPQVIYIISDMEFDDATVWRGHSSFYHCTSKPYRPTNFEEIRRKYAEAGYEMPQLVFWNVDARNRHVPVEHNQDGVALVSGFSPSIFANVVQGKSPREYVDEILGRDKLKEVEGLVKTV